MGTVINRKRPVQHREKQHPAGAFTQSQTGMNRRGELEAFKKSLSGGLFGELSPPCGAGVTERQMG